MDMDGYQQAAETTARYPKEVGLAYVGLGLAGEAGEIANKIKKVYRDSGGKLTLEQRADLAAELGDVLWYCAALATEMDTTLSRVAYSNLSKLASRAERGTIQGSGDTR